MNREILDKTYCNMFFCSLINITIGLISSLKYNFIMFVFIIYKLFNYININDKTKKRNYIIDIIEFFIGYLTGIGAPLMFNSFKKII
tara:strand:- start:536 stop:796 length:261 start_codon:yes stop_codon:yes gene_type:complete